MFLDFLFQSSQRRKTGNKKNSFVQNLSKTAAEVGMSSRRSRYFVNKYKDFSGSLGNVEYLRELAQRVLKLIDERSPPQRASCDGRLYVGGAGIGYAFYAVAQSSEFANIREQCLMKALEYMQVIPCKERLL